MVLAIATYKVKLIGLDGEDNEFEVVGDCYILGLAEEAGVELPYSCRAGACSTYAGQMTYGSVNQSDGSFLGDDPMEKGYVLTVCHIQPRTAPFIHTKKSVVFRLKGGLSANEEYMKIRCRFPYAGGLATFQMILIKH